MKWVMAPVSPYIETYVLIRLYNLQHIPLLVRGMQLVTIIFVRIDNSLHIYYYPLFHIETKYDVTLYYTYMCTWYYSVYRVYILLSNCGTYFSVNYTIYNYAYVLHSLALYNICNLTNNISFICRVWLIWGSIHTP